MSTTPKGIAPDLGGKVVVARYGRDLEDFTIGDV